MWSISTGYKSMDKYLCVKSVSLVILSAIQTINRINTADKHQLLQTRIEYKNSGRKTCFVLYKYDLLKFQMFPKKGTIHPLCCQGLKTKLLVCIIFVVFVLFSQCYIQLMVLVSFLIFFLSILSEFIICKITSTSIYSV